MVVRTVLVTLCSMVFVVTASAEQKSAPIVFPKDKSIVGSRVNLVLDPTEVPFFQIIVGKTEYPIVDTSTGKHAFQGLELEPGLNVITIKVFAPPPPEEKDKAENEKHNGTKGPAKGDASKQKLVLLSTWERQVFSMRGLATVGTAPTGFNKEPFHSREHETGCSGCHELEAPPRDAPLPKKPEDMICYACHRKIPTGKYTHGPAALWNCLGCHDPELYPVKYQFTSADPWKVVKTTQTVEPKVFTLSTTPLFKPGTAVIVSKEKAMDVFADVLNFIKQNLSYKILLEVHTDTTPPLRIKAKKVKGKTVNTGYKSNLALTKARAKALVSLLKESGVNVKNITAAGMGDKLPKAPNKSTDGKELNNRLEIVVHPADVKVKNSRKLPVLKDRDRVLISLNYSQGPQVRKLTVIEKVPKGRRYVKGSGFVQGLPREPRLKNDELVWELGDMDVNFTEALSYVVKKDKDAKPIPEQVAISFTAGAREQTREFDPALPSKRGMTIKEACLKCHVSILDKTYSHGPAVAGYCTLCHDPHASMENAWLRKPVWELCTACHTDKVAGEHRFLKSHPMQNKKDPMRPGKRLSCVSCHDPHSAEAGDLFAYNKKKSFELCKLCHAK